MAAQEKLFLCRDILFSLFPEKSEQHFPESVLAVAVIKICLPALYGRETAQDEHLAVRIVNRLKSVNYV